MSAGWFRRISRQLFPTLYPHCSQLFVFSRGWFTGFLERYDISRRRTTRMATKLPAEYIQICNSFLRFVQRNSQLQQPQQAEQPVMSINNVLSSPSRRFPLCRILNYDKTPIPYEYTEGYTYNTKGEKTISVRSIKSGWEKRKTTLVLIIHTDGVLRLMPIIIFKGKGNMTNEERQAWNKDVKVYFDDNAYNNEELFTRWIFEELIP